MVKLRNIDIAYGKRKEYPNTLYSFSIFQVSTEILYELQSRSVF